MSEELSSLLSLATADKAGGAQAGTGGQERWG